jgi:hypothetical protein
MPTVDELEGLYKDGAGKRNMTLLMKTTGWYVWSGETKGSSGAWHFYFPTGDICKKSATPCTKSERGKDMDKQAWEQHVINLEGEIISIMTLIADGHKKRDWDIIQDAVEKLGELVRELTKAGR